MEYNDAEMIKNPVRWPRWPRLPLTRKDDSKPFGKEFGIILEGDLTAVRLMSLYDTGKDAKRLAYDSVEELLADGWAVD